MLPGPVQVTRPNKHAWLHGFHVDFAGFGESGGAPRQAQMPVRKIANINAVAEYVSTLSYVNPRTVGYLAVCASAQYVLAAITGGGAISSFVSVAGWFQAGKDAGQHVPQPVDHPHAIGDQVRPMPGQDRKIADQVGVSIDDRQVLAQARGRLVEGATIHGWKAALGALAVDRESSTWRSQ